VDPASKTPPGDSFTIEDGCLKSLPKPRITEDLFTAVTFRDFELSFEWKISPGGNSGVKYRIQDHQFLMEDTQPKMKFENRANLSFEHRRPDRPATGQDYVVGFEYQLLDNSRNADAKKGTNHQAGALYDAVPPVRDMTRPVGEWNESRLVVKGDHVEHWLNGVKVVDSSLNAPEVAAGAAARWTVGTPIYNLLVKHPRTDCPISLQNHDTEAWFKNIKIRKL
jgi:hypothetical protein